MSIANKFISMQIKPIFIRKLGFTQRLVLNRGTWKLRNGLFITDFKSNVFVTLDGDMVSAQMCTLRISLASSYCR